MARRPVVLLSLSTLLLASLLAGCIDQPAPPEVPEPDNLTFTGAPWRVVMVENATDGEGVWLNLTMLPAEECSAARGGYEPVQSLSIFDYHGFQQRIALDAPLGATTSHRIALEGDGPFVLAGGQLACADANNSTLSGVAVGRQIDQVQFDGAGDDAEDLFVKVVSVQATIATGGSSAMANWDNKDPYVFGFQRVDVDGDAAGDEPTRGVGIVSQTLTDSTGRVQYQSGCAMVVQGCSARAGPYVYVEGSYTFELTSETPVVPGEMTRGLLLTVNRLQPDICALGFHWDLCGGVDGEMEEDPHAHH